MHELHMIHDLVDDMIRLGKDENAAKITHAHVTMGNFTEINPEIFEFQFKEFIKGTIAEGCELEIEHSNARELRLDSFSMY